jgi:hypothetical protein
MAWLVNAAVSEAESGRKEQEVESLLYRFAGGKSFHIISPRHTKVE